MPVINLNLDSNSIDDAIKQLKEYAKKVDELSPKLVDELIEKGVITAKEVASYMDIYDSGDLVNGIICGKINGEGYVISTAYHSAFVEMGTGIRGQMDPNPYNYYPGWSYDVNDHGEKGWVYKGDDGEFHWTQGMPHRPFMYETAQILRQSIPYVAEKILKDDE